MSLVAPSNQTHSYDITKLIFFLVFQALAPVLRMVLGKEMVTFLSELL